MDPGTRSAGSSKMVKTPNVCLSRSPKVSTFGENANPNLPNSSPAVKSAKSQRSPARNPIPVKSPGNVIRGRRVVFVKKKKGSEVCEKCKERGDKKCLCVAREILKASQEQFFETIESGCADKTKLHGDQIGKSGEEKPKIEQGCECDVVGKQSVVDEEEAMSEMGSVAFKRSRDRLMEEARESLPKEGFGRVVHLVKAFEKQLSVRKNGEEEEGERLMRESEEARAEFYDLFMSSRKKVVNWALPGMEGAGKEESGDCRESLSSFCPSDLFLTSEKLGLESRSASWDNNSLGSFSASSGAGAGGRRSRRNSTESCGSFGGSKLKKKQLKVTHQKPFKLRTEQRGRMKEEEFMNKIRQMLEEQERKRIPIAQGLPWTTDEPECLVKPPVKESTMPIDLQLHSDIRAVERAEFDHQVEEKMSLLEQYRMERERQQKLAEEEEIRQLRKELVPKAQPMPYFDRPFIPRRSEKNPTVPKEPKFHIPHHKKTRCMSLTDFGPYTFHP